VARADGGGYFPGSVAQLAVVAVGAGEAGSGSLVESETKLDLWRRVYQSFIEIFDGLDEVALAENDVGVLRNAERDSVKIQGLVSRRRSQFRSGLCGAARPDKASE
jgi:hypothetical protein